MLALAQNAAARRPHRDRRSSTAPSEDEIKDELDARRAADQRARRCSSTAARGEPFDDDVTVGVMYMLKLHHLVDDKIHAR